MGAKTAQTSGTSNGSSTTTLAPNVQAAYDSLLSQFGGLANTAQGNPTVSNSVSGLTNLAANDNPAFGQAASTISSSLNPAYNTVGNYLSPYLKDALSAQVAVENQQNQQQQQGLVGNAIANGSFGGNRVGLAQAALAGQQQLANNATNSGLINNAYSQALAAAQQQQGLTQSAGAGLTNVGTAQNQASLSNLLGLLSAGQFQQTAPYSNLASLSGAVSGLSNAGATTTTTGNTTGTVPVGNTFSGILGGLTSLAGLFAPKAAGGRVRGFDVGGIADQMAQERGQSAAQAMQDSENIITSMMANEQQQQKQDQADWQNTLNSPQTKAGVGVIKGLFNPINDNNVPDASGRNVYAVGGLVGRRGYDDGGFVDMGQTFNPDLYSTAFPPLTGLSSNPTSYANPDPRDMIVDPSVAGTPSVEGLSGPSAGGSGLAAQPQSNVVPFVPRGTQPTGLVVSAPVPLAPQRNIPPIDTSPSALTAIDNAAAPSSGLVAGPASSGHVPLSVANNNPGNIKVSPWTMKQPGFVGSNGPFAVFDSQQSGQGAMNNLLTSYADSGNNTISSIISKWSPQSANAPGSTANYISYVSQRTGLNPTQPLAPGQIPIISKAMSEFESGQRGSGPISTAGLAAPSMASQDAPPQPSGLIGGGLGTPAITSPVVSGVIQPTGGYGVPDSNAGYATNIRDVFNSLSQGHGLNLSPDARMALISAGAGMMGGTSPNAFANIGSGIQQGLDTWQKKQVLNRENEVANSSIAAQQAGIGLAGMGAQQAGMQIYNQMQEIKAQIALLTAQAGKTGVEAAMGRFTPTVGGELIVDPNHPEAGPTLIPWSQVMSTGSQANEPAPQPDKDGFMLTAPSGPPNPLVMSPTTAPLVVDQTQKALSAAQDQAIGAQSLNAKLGELTNLAKDMSPTGILSQGAGFDQRLDAVKGVNAILTTMGMQPVDATQVGSAEGMRKLSTQIQAELADSWKTDPAASTIAQAGQATPSGENSAQGFNRIIGNLQALNKRATDRYAYLTDWSNKHYGDLTGADAAFNQANPPQKYVQYGAGITNNLNNPSGTQGNPVVPQSQADIDNAPSGTIFKVNGQLMRKP